MSSSAAIPLAQLVKTREVHLQTGPFGTQLKASDYTDMGIPVINVRNIGFGRTRPEKLEYISPETRNRLSSHVLKANDIVFGRKGAVERHALMRAEEDGWFQGSDCIRMRITSERLDARFVSYFFLTADHQRWMMNQCSHGATMASLNQEILERIEIPFPPLPKQRRIAGILSAYDDLIENCQRRIQILEEMARRLYREWFVHFRYPGHELLPRVMSPLGPIPQNWQVCTVGEIVKRIPPGRKYDQRTVSEAGLVPVFDQGRSGIIGYHSDEPGVTASTTNPVVVFANHTCYQRLVHVPFSAIQNVLPFVPNPSIPRDIYWLHYATRELVTFNDYKGHWPEFAAKLVLVPPEHTTSQFGCLVRPVELQVLGLQDMIDNLRRTRDLLLPRLLGRQNA